MNLKFFMDAVSKKAKQFKDLKDFQQTRFKKSFLQSVSIQEWEADSLAKTDTKLQDLLMEMNPIIPKKWHDDITNPVN